MKKKYKKPKLSSKKIKLNFFLGNVKILNPFDIIGTVYAQYGGAGGGDANPN